MIHDMIHDMMHDRSLPNIIPLLQVLHATSSYHPGLVALNGGAGNAKNGPPHAVVNAGRPRRQLEPGKNVERWG